MRAALHDRAHALGLLARFTPVQPDAIRHWLHGLHYQHFIITILGRSITATQLARVSKIIAAQGMNIDRIDRLSAELSPQNAGANACVELAVSGDGSREANMRAEFLGVAKELSIDVAFQRRVALLKGLPAERVFGLLDEIPLADRARLPLSRIQQHGRGIRGRMVRLTLSLR